MKRVYMFTASILISIGVNAQVEEEVADTTRMNVGRKEVIIVKHKVDKESEVENEFYMDEGDTVYACKKKKKGEAHWAGIDYGFTMLMNGGFENNFPAQPYWNNDAARSQTLNINFLEHKFDIAKQYFGLTTGLGFSFTSIGFNDNYVLENTADTLFAAIDTVYNYKRNKLNATYLTVPLLLEFNTHKKAKKSFYLAVGAVGGVRLGSKITRNGKYDGKDFRENDRGKHGLNPFKLDAAVRIGYNSWGAFANYSLLPLFDTRKTVEVYPLTFGLSFNFN